MAVAQPGTQDATRTEEFRNFKGANLTDLRTAIEDTEFAWLENLVPIGAGNVQVVPGPASALATLPVTIQSLWGVVLTLSGVSTPLLMAVGTDGSLRQINQATGIVTLVAAAGVLTTKARLTQWKDTTVLVVDPTKGYFSWDGTTWTTIDATKTATDIAVFSGRAWLVTAARTITFTAPDSYSDFVVGDGSGSTKINDPLFQGQITRLVASLENLWIFAPGAIEAISNVAASGTAPNVTTTFQVTNIVGNLGSPFPSSVIPFFRSILFFSPFGIYALVGATPQKLSAKLDGMFPAFVLGTDVPAAVTEIYRVPVWVGLVQWTDPDSATTKPILLTFMEGKWSWQSITGVTWITTLVVAGDPQCWAAIGTTVVRLFGDTTVSVAYKLKTKLWAFGRATQRKEWIRLGLELQSTNVISPTIQVENENSQTLVPTVTATPNTITFTGAGGAAITFTGAGGNAITWITVSLQLIRQAVQIIGRYLGLTLSGTAAAFTLAGISLQIKPAGDWN